MLTACLCALLQVFQLPRPVATLDLSDATTTYLRRDGASDRLAVDLETLPRATGALVWHRARLRVEYGPRLTAGDVGDPAQRSFNVMHLEQTEVEGYNARTRLVVRNRLAIGRELPFNLSQQAAIQGTVTTTGARVNLLPATSSLSILTVRTEAVVTRTLSRRLTLDAEASHGISGGRGEAAQEALPRAQVGRLAARLAARLTRRHQLEGAASATRMMVSSGYEHWMGDGAALWTMVWTPRTHTAVGAGAAVQHTRLPDERLRTLVQPVTSVRVDHQATRSVVRTTLGAEGLLAPRLNALTGELQLAAQGNATVAFTHDDTTVRLLVDAYQTLPTDESGAARVIGGGVLGEHRLTTWLELLMIGRLQDQKVVGSVPGLPLQWTAALGIRVVSPTLRH